MFVLNQQFITNIPVEPEIQTVQERITTERLQIIVKNI